MKKRYLLVLLIIVGGILGWQRYFAYPPAVELTSQEKATMERFLQGMSTRCVGRYLIDMPASFYVQDGNVMAFINESPVKTQRVYRPAFEQKIRLREAELRKTKPLYSEDAPFLKRVHSLPVGMEGVIFEHNKSKSVPDVSRILEAHLYINGVAVEIKTKARNGLAERYAEKRSLYPEIYQNTVPQKITELISLLQRISSRKETEIPQQPGFCLPNIFIADNDKLMIEKVELGYTSEAYPSLFYDIETDNVSRTGTSLLERHREMEKNIRLTEGKTLRKGRRDLNGLYAEEWLAKGRLDSRCRGLRFAVNVNEKKCGPAAPRMSVDFMQRGESGNNQLTDDEAIAGWQQITSTLRMRPGALRK